MEDLVFPVGGNMYHEHYDTESSCTSEVDPNDIQMAEIHDANFHLISENQALKLQLNKALQFTDEMKLLNNKNVILTNQLREANQRSESLQQRLRISQQKNQDLISTNQEIQTTVQSAMDEREQIRSAMRKDADELLQLRQTVTTLKNSLSEAELNRRQFLEACSSLFGTGCDCENAVIVHIKELTTKRESELKLLSERHSFEKSELDKALQSSLTQLRKTQKRLGDSEKQNAALERAYEQCESSLKVLEAASNELSEENETLKRRVESVSKQNEQLRQHESQLTEMITQMQQARQQETEKYQELLKIRDDRIQEFKEASTTRILNDEMIAELSELRRHKQTLESANEELRGNTESLSHKLAVASQCIKRMQSEKNQTKKKFSQMKTVQDEITRSNERLLNENRMCNDALEALKLENERLKEKSREQPAPIICETKVRNNAVVFEPILDQQRKEIETLSKERVHLTTVIHKQTSLLIASERVCAEYEQKISELQRRLTVAENQKPVVMKPQVTPVSHNENDCLHRIMPILRVNFIGQIRGDAKAELDEILSQPVIDPVERIQECGKRVSAMIYSNENSQSAILLSAAITSLTKMLNASRNTSMVDFLASETRLLETKLGSIRADSIMPLFNGTYEERIRVLEEIKRDGWKSKETFDLLTMLVLASCAQEKEFKSASEQLEEARSWISDYKSRFGDIDVPSLEQSIIRLHGCACKSKKLQKQLTKAANIESYCNELKKTVEDQDKVIASLKANAKILSNDAETLQHHLTEKTQQLTSLESAYKSLQNDSANLKLQHLKEVESYEKQIDSKSQESRNNAIQLAEIKSRCESESTTFKSENDKLRAKLVHMEHIARTLKDKLIQSEEKNRAQIESRKRENEAEIEHLASIQSDLKAKLKQTVSVMKDQISENQSLLEQIQSLKASNQSAGDELARLTMENKACELKLQSVNEQMARDREVLETQFRFRAMSEETRHQDEIAMLKSHHANELNAVLLTLVEEFEELANIENHRSHEFQKMIHKIGREYRNMKVRLCM